MDSILIFTLFLLGAGGYMLINQENRLSEALGKQKNYPPDLVSKLLGGTMLAMGLSCIPCLIGLALKIPVLYIVGLVFLVASPVVAFLLERRYKKRRNMKK